MAQRPPHADVAAGITLLLALTLGTYVVVNFGDIGRELRRAVPHVTATPRRTVPRSGCAGRSGTALTVCEAKAYARGRVRGAEQWSCLATLWEGESGWNPWATNPRSKAYGIPQILPRAHGHPVPLGDARRQIDWGLAYITRRYGTPCRALDFWRSHTPHWY